MKTWLPLGICALISLSFQLAVGPAFAAQSEDKQVPHVEPLAAADSSVLTGELKCSFTDADGRVLLLGAGYVAGSEAPSGVIRMDAGAVALEGKVKGGYEALVDGPHFTSSNGISAHIDRAPEQVPEDGVEYSKWKASLSVKGKNGESASFGEGIWTCGP